MTEIWARLKSIMQGLLQRSHIEKDMADELGFHIDARADELVRNGLSLDAALQRARAEFGSIEKHKEYGREARGLRTFDELRGDLRFALRHLRRNWSTAAVCFLTVGLAMGVTTVIYGLSDSMTNRAPRGVVNPDRLLTVWAHDKRPDFGAEYVMFVYPQYLDLLRSQDIFTDLAAVWRFSSIVSDKERAEQVNIASVTGNYFSTLGISPAMGRAIVPGDDREDTPMVVMLSHAFWRSRYGGDPNAVGRHLRVNGGKKAEIIGVLPEDYFDIAQDYNAPDVWIPIAPQTTTASLLSDRSPARRVMMIGRLRPEVTYAQAEARLNVLLSSISLIPSDRWQASNIGVLPIRKARIREFAGYRAGIANFFLIMGAVASVSLIAACLNVASFLLGQGFTRRHEIAVRYALGASRGRVVRQLLTESLLMGTVSAVVGFISAICLAELAERLPPVLLNAQIQLPFDAGSMLQGGILGFLLGLTIFVTLLFGFVPAVMVSMERPMTYIKSRRSPLHWVGVRTSPREILLIIQVAITTVLAITAGLYIQSTRQIVALKPDYPTDSVLLTQIVARAVPPKDRANFYRTFLQSLNEHPDVSSASIGWNPPFNQGWTIYRSSEDPDRIIESGSTAAGPHFFRTHRIPVIAGREFEFSRATSVNEIVINHVLAEQLWPHDDAVGKTLLSGGTISTGPLTQSTVIGVVRMNRCLDLMSEPHPCAWRDFALDGTMGYLRIHTRGNPLLFMDRVREIARKANPEVAFRDIRTEDDQLAQLKPVTENLRWNDWHFGNCGHFIRGHWLLCVVLVNGERSASRNRDPSGAWSDGLRFAHGSGREKRDCRSAWDFTGTAVVHVHKFRHCGPTLQNKSFGSICLRRRYAAVCDNGCGRELLVRTTAGPQRSFNRTPV